MAGKRRQMIFVTELNADSFVFLFEQGDGTNSWSIRDYSTPHRVAGPRYAGEFNFALEELSRKVLMRFDAPTHRTSDLEFWHQHTLGLNRAHLADRTGLSGFRATSAPFGSPRVKSDASVPFAFPIVGRAEFDQHPKSRKPKDLKRMLFSNASEDWVTWTAFQLLESITPQTWWADLGALAKAGNPSLALPHGWEQTPEIELWETIASPTGYERASRQRMRTSDDAKRFARSHDPKPVEGMSEIDVILRNSTMLLFVEAKLGSDISPTTTYDPLRNQIVRNIDCVLDQAGTRVPMFWMLVHDAGQGRSYTQLLSHYRAEPTALVRELPHHDPDRVVALAQSLSLILWKDFVQDVVHLYCHDDEQTMSIKNELWRRVTCG